MLMQLKCKNGEIVYLNENEQSEVYEFYRLHCTMERIDDISDKIAFKSDECFERVARHILELIDDYNIPENTAINTVINDETYMADYIKPVKYREIIITEDIASKIKRLLETQPTCESECFGEDEKITYSARFDDGYEIDVQLCGVQYEESNNDNTPWTQAVLYKNGSEICFTEPSDEFFGKWVLETDDATYIVNVIDATELREVIK